MCSPPPLGFHLYLEILGFAFFRIERKKKKEIYIYILRAKRNREFAPLSEERYRFAFCWFVLHW